MNHSAASLLQVLQTLPKGIPERHEIFKSNDAEDNDVRSVLRRCVVLEQTAPKKDTFLCRYE